MPRAQCIVIRQDRILMAHHSMNSMEWWCLPGGAIEAGETPEDAALRELQEECNVKGRIVRQTSIWNDGTPGGTAYSYYVQIGEQEPSLGIDPEVADNPILIGLRWMRLNEIPERDRAFLWAAGLLGVESFFKEVEKWGEDPSYPDRVLEIVPDTDPK